MRIRFTSKVALMVEESDCFAGRMSKYPIWINIGEELEVTREFVKKVKRRHKEGGPYEIHTMTLPKDSPIGRKIYQRTLSDVPTYCYEVIDDNDG